MPSPVKRSSVPFVLADQRADRAVILAEDQHDVLGLGGLGEAVKPRRSQNMATISRGGCRAPSRRPP
jgi:hypothetical protein